MSGSGLEASGYTSPASSGRAVLAPGIDSSVLVGYPAAQKYLGFDGHPSTIYLRAQTDRVNAVDNCSPYTANPENPSGVDVSQPSAALVAQADAKSALNGQFLGLRRSRLAGRRGRRRQHHDHLRA